MKQTSELFDAIAPSYDRLNHILSLGLHRRWKCSLGHFLPDGNSLNILDAATGTADTAIELARHFPNVSTVVGLDPSYEMIKIAREKVRRNRLGHKIILKLGCVECIPYDDSSFDALSMSFGIRNVVDHVKALHEMNRVLKPEGRLIILEFSRPSNSFIKFFYHGYMNFMVQFFASIISGDRKAYEYLYRSIKEFPPSRLFCQIMEKAGFIKIKTRTLCFGAVTIYTADKM